ncbi:MAG: hypothetical protein FWG15_08570 [Propionibacteriaceae bacterium]|nr:hypothetical protein [Propionibacteriaceae bacterium]
MAYTMVRVPIWNTFKNQEADFEFKTKTYPALDNYLCLMESRGWTIEHVTAGSDGMSVLITFHRGEVSADR